MECHADAPGFYIGADVAYVEPTVDMSDGINFGGMSGVVHVLPESVRFDDSMLGWNASIGYRINRYLSAELAYLDFGATDVEETFDLPDSVGSGEFTLDFKLRVAGPMVSVIGALPLAERLEAYGRAGVLWGRQEVRLTPQFSLNDAEEQWGLGLGLRARLGSGWSARLEYQRFEDIDGTELSGDLRLEKLSLGVTYDLASRVTRESPVRAPETDDRKGFYAVADLGVTEPTAGKSNGSLIAFTFLPGIVFHVSPSSVSSDGSDAGGGATLGYRINRHLAAELAYTDFGEVEVREHYVFGPVDSPFLPFVIPQIDFDREYASRVAGPSVSVLGILPVGDLVEFFARAGMLFADQDSSREPSGRAANAEELLIWGAGMDVELTRRWSLRFAYENLDSLRKSSFTGPIRMERFVFGVGYDF
jgi:opacity protein-like surface antigen